jgi:HAD superfamily hydrolase (TIGR01509 family)
MIKAAIFDVDGTLLDTMPFWATVGTRMIKKAGLTPVEGLDKAVLFMTLEESCAFIKGAYGLPDTIESLVQNVIKEVTDFYLYEAQPKKGIPAFLEALADRGVKMAIATASDKRLVKYSLMRMGLDKYFGEIFTCSELNLNKRNGEIYLHAARYLGYGASDCAVFEDILVAVRSAKEAGFFTVAIEDNESAGDKEEIIKAADLYVSDKDGFNGFWSVMK